MSFRLVFDPISGTFDFRNVQAPGIAGAGGGNIVTGTIVIPSGTLFFIAGEFIISPDGEISVESGGEILIQ